MDQSLVGTHEQPSVAYGQAITLALDLCRPLLFSISRIVGMDDPITTDVKGVPAHRESNRMLAMDLPLEELGQLGSDPLDLFPKLGMFGLQGLVVFPAFKFLGNGRLFSE